MTMLAATLSRDHSVHFVSFSRQYPGWLFPGQTDLDPSKQKLKVDNVEYLLDSLNPLTWTNTGKAIVAESPDLFLLSWWTVYWTLPFRAVLAKIRKAGIYTTIICHNLVDHESARWKKAATRAFLSQGDRLVTHSASETYRLRELLGHHVRAETAFLPTFAPLSMSRPSRDAARKELSLEGYVLLFFGFVRPYKGLQTLLDALPRVRKHRPVTLLVVGEFWKGKDEYLSQIRRLGIQDCVRVIDRYIPNEELGTYFVSADLVVQPYLAATGSGICQLAYGFDKPVIATTVGSLAEVVQDRVNGRLVPPGDPEYLSQAIVESLEPQTLQSLTHHAKFTKDRFSWEQLAKIITET